MLSEQDILRQCLAMLKDRNGISKPERDLIASVPSPRSRQIDLDISDAEALRGPDSLGAAFERARTLEDRRELGAIYTPTPIVDAMLGWAKSRVSPARVVDPGAGSGRFILAAAARFPNAELVAVEKDPLAALMLRANLAVRGLSSRTKVVVDDYRSLELPKVAGPTLFIGNPPYVRHHDVGGAWKKWYGESFAGLGINASLLAGLHAHFFLKTRFLAAPGDYGCFITSAEWLDVNYGSALRRLFQGELGGISIHALDPSLQAFPGTATTAAISSFEVGSSRPTLYFQSVNTLASLGETSKGRRVARCDLAKETRWSSFLRPQVAPTALGGLLGDLFRVHRGQVTGANQVWIAGPEAEDIPGRFKFPTVTKATDLFQAGANLKNLRPLRRVIDLPVSLDDLAAAEREAVEAFLSWAKARGADQGYVARHRKSWWSVGLREPAPILCTYMARRAPQFTLNPMGARHINIAHGLYPRRPMAPSELASLVEWLNANVGLSLGRVYAGGLTKFEPGEVEKIRIPVSTHLAA